MPLVIDKVAENMNAAIPGQSETSPHKGAEISDQPEAVGAQHKRLLVIAGAGSGKTEVMARRVAWWVAVEKCPTSEIIAFTFTEAAAEELKFRIRSWLQRVAQPGEDVAIGPMYIGTIHGFCLQALRDLAPATSRPKSRIRPPLRRREWAKLRPRG